ncbi:MAG: DUF3656 domain-containing U32 family peptidase [Bacillota bacterium]
MTKNNRAELLAPCGDWDAFLAAVENGADAVYLGGRLFSARQFASNFDLDKLKEAIQYAHIRNVSVYLTMNTLMSDSELSEALDFLQDAYLAGIDGVIVQDIGFAGLVKNLIPDLPLHASTQMTTYNLEGVRVLEELGFERVVLARELSIDEIKYIAQNTMLEIEVFIHGALCISYSGQCLMSSIIGGRSGNRGKCAQPCRLPYQFIDKYSKNQKADLRGKSYLLSPKDLCTIDILDEIVDSGVKSLKIEGRMKNPEYVAAVVGTYRKYLDKVLENTGRYNESIEEKDKKVLAQAFNRGGFSKGYFRGKSGRDMMSYEKPKNWGIYLGEVISYDRASGTLKLKLEEELSMGDGIEIWNGEDESPGTIVTAIKINGKNVSEAGPFEAAAIGNVKGRISRGNKVYKTSDRKLNAIARETFSGKPARKIFIQGNITIRHGEPVFLKVKDDLGNEAEVKGSYMPEEAVNRPLTEERILDQIRKTGQTAFEFSEVNIGLGNNLSIPVSEINNVRRKALEQLEKTRASRYTRRKPDNWDEKIEVLEHFPGNGRNKERKLKISAYFYKPIEGCSIENLDVDRLYLPFGMFLKGKGEEIVSSLKGRDTEIFVLIPPITRGNYDTLIKFGLNDVVELGIDGLIIGNLGSLEYARAYSGISIMGDYSLNIFNSSSMGVLKDLGFNGVTLSPELNLNQIKALKEIPGLTKEVMVYGRIPLMTSEYCPVGSVAGNFGENSKCSAVCSKGDFTLKDRMNMEFPVVCDRIDCRSTIFNANVLLLADSTGKLKSSGIDMLRLGFTDEKPHEVKQIVDMHRSFMNNDIKALADYKDLIDKIKEKGFTKGHFLRGV